MSSRALVSGLVGSLLIGAVAHGDIHRDGSIGPGPEIQPAFVDDTWQVPESLGARSADGGNLFHSFDAFRLDSGDAIEFGWDAAGFSTPPERMVIRETGTDFSVINGRFDSSALTGTDVYFFDPDGLFVGSAGSLDVDGSLFLSTADTLHFGADRLSADAQQPVVLSVAAPFEFGFDPGPHGSLQVLNEVTVPAGETLGLVGQEVVIRAVSGSVDVGGRGAHVAIASRSGEGRIPVDIASHVPAPVAGTPATLTIGSASANTDIDVSGGNDAPSGRIVIRGERFVLNGDLQASQNLAGTAPSRRVDVRLADDFEFIDGRIDAGGRAGDLAPVVRIEARTIEIQSGAEIRSATSQDSLGGRIELFASSRIDIAGSVRLQHAGASAAGGAIELQAPEVAIAGGSVITAPDALLQSASGGAGGPIRVGAARVSLSSGGRLVSSAGSEVGGGIEIDASESVTLSTGGQIFSQAVGDGAGGAVRITAARLDVIADDASSAGSAVVSRSETSTPAAVGGDIRLEVAQLSLRDGGQVRSETAGSASAGALRVVDADIVSLSGSRRFAGGDVEPSGLTARALPGSLAGSRGGPIDVAARVIEIEGGGQIATSTQGAGDAGTLRITGDELRVTGGDRFSLVSASTFGTATGAGSTIEIVVARLALIAGGRIDSSTAGPGDAGSITLDVDTLDVRGKTTAGEASGLATLTSGAGNGGSIAVAARGDVVLSNGAAIEAGAEGSGAGAAGRVEVTAANIYASDARIESRSTSANDAGGVVLDAASRIDLSRSTVTAKATNASGGRVVLRAGERIFGLASSIDAEVLQGAGGGGDVELRAPVVALDNTPVLARAIDGAGGNILLSGEGILRSLSPLNATSRTGLDGDTQVDAPTTQLAAELAGLTVDLVDPSALARRPCDARTERQGSFVATPRRIDLAVPGQSPGPVAPLGACSVEDGG